MSARAGAPANEHYQWMLENWEAYKRSISKFNDGILRGRVDFDVLTQAYEEIVLVWINARDADDVPSERHARSIADDLRQLITRFMNSSRISHGACSAWWDRYRGGCLDFGVEVDQAALPARPDQ